MKSSTGTIIKALEVLAQEIQSPDGAANAAIAEAAERLQELSNDVLAKRVVELRAERDALAAQVDRVRSVLTQDVLELLSGGVRANYSKESVNDALAKYWIPVVSLVEEDLSRKIRQQAQGEQC